MGVCPGLGAGAEEGREETLDAPGLIADWIDPLLLSLFLLLAAAFIFCLLAALIRFFSSNFFVFALILAKRASTTGDIRPSSGSGKGSGEGLGVLSESTDSEIWLDAGVLGA